MSGSHVRATDTTSLWRAGAGPVESDPFVLDAHYDDVIAGGGLTGLVTGLLLQRLGRRVLIAEAREVGAVTTGNTTAKLSLLQGSHLSRIRERNTAKVTRAYVDANTAGATWLLAYLETAGVPVQRRTAYSYAQTAEGRAAVQKEYEVTRAAGLPTRLVDRLDVPFPSFGAVALDDQAEFDPMDVLRSLAADFRAAGGTLVQGVRVLGMTAGDPVRVRTSAGTVTGDRAYLLTGIPVLDRGLYFSKVRALRSYGLAFRVPEVTEGMYLSVDQPTRSVRDATVDGERYLVIGGNGHPVGRETSAAANVADLRAWTERFYPGAELVNTWSAQDYEPFHRVPFVGWLPRGRGRIFLATGYDKWGMSNAVQASLTLVGDLQGETPPWARVLHRRPTLPRVLAEATGAGLAVGAWYARGYWAALRAPASASVAPAEGEGVLARDGVTPVAVSTLEGRRCAVSAVCPHLGAILNWNDVERSWDCPAHGSRFAADGTLLEGPATRSLEGRG